LRNLSGIAARAAARPRAPLKPQSLALYFMRRQLVVAG
jgi:hypothetical protein